MDKLLYSYKWPYRILRHLAYWCFWLGFYGIVNSQYHGTEFYKWLLFELYTMLVKVPFAYGLAYVIFPTFIPRKKYLGLIIVVLLLALVGLVALMFLYQLFPFPMPNGVGGFSTPKTLYMYTDLLYIASPVVLIKMTQEYIAQQKRSSELRQAKAEAEMKLLKNQLQPHFLFNNLNNIYSMVVTGHEYAAGSVLKLSELLSYMLYGSNNDKVLISQEVNLLNNYLELEKLRYGDRLSLSFENNLENESIMIAPLIFLPFVENAFKHGVSKDPVPGSWIRLVLETKKECVNFFIENKLTATEGTDQGTELTSGIGLTNIRRRLELIYPNQHELTISKKETFFVQLSIKL